VGQSPAFAASMGVDCHHAPPYVSSVRHAVGSCRCVLRFRLLERRWHRVLILRLQWVLVVTMHRHTWTRSGPLWNFSSLRCMIATRSAKVVPLPLSCDIAGIHGRACAAARELSSLEFRHRRHFARSRHFLLSFFILLVILVRRVREVRRTTILFDAVHVCAIIAVYGVVDQGSARVI